MNKENVIVATSNTNEGLQMFVNIPAKTLTDKEQWEVQEYIKKKVVHYFNNDTLGDDFFVRMKQAKDELNRLYEEYSKQGECNV